MLTKFKLVRSEGLKGLRYEGRFIPFDKIDDILAEKLIGKTHVLERIAEAPADDKKRTGSRKLTAKR